MRQWTHVGSTINPKLSAERVMAAMEELRWHDVTPDLQLPMSPGLAIQHMIAELRLPRVTRVGLSNGLAPYGLYAVECRFRDGPVTVYAIDTGTEVIPVCSDFEEAA